MTNQAGARHTVIVYSTTHCGYCVRLKRQLEEAGVSYRSIDIDMNQHHGDRIAEVTGGPRTVPTVEVADHLIVNPSVGDVLRVLGAVN